MLKFGTPDSSRLSSRSTRSLVIAGAALADTILLGRPASPAGGAGGSGSDAVLQAVVLLGLVLGAALTFAYAFGLLSPHDPQAHRRPHRRSSAGSVGEDPLLPGPPSPLFPPSHHERIHDAKYLQRMLEAEQRRRGSGRRSQGSDSDGSGPRKPPA